MKGEVLTFHHYSVHMLQRALQPREATLPGFQDLLRQTREAKCNMVNGGEWEREKKAEILRYIIYIIALRPKKEPRLFTVTCSPFRRSI